MSKRHNKQLEAWTRAYQCLEPRNIARARGGGFCLIDFSESRKHTCKEVQYMTTSVSWLLTFNLIKVSKLGTQATLAPDQTCSELQTLRNCLGKQQLEQQPFQKLISM